MYDMIGLLGAASYLGAYLMLQTGRIDTENGYSYVLLNLCGATFCLISLSNSFNLPSMITQLCWIVISLYGVLRMKINKSKIHSESETPKVQMIYSQRAMGQVDAVYIDGRLSWSRNQHRRA